MVAIQMDRHTIFEVGRKAAEMAFDFLISLMTNVVLLHVYRFPSVEVTKGALEWFAFGLLFWRSILLFRL